MVNQSRWRRLCGSLSSHSCALCGAVASHAICPACADQLSWIGHACGGCGIPLPYPALCALCQLKPLPFSRCIAPFAYEAPVSHLLRAFKYRQQLHYGRLLCEFLIDRLRQCADLGADAIVPAPLHWRRRWGRGFNQAEMIGDELARALDIPLRARWLRRIRATPPQQDLNAEQRRRNLRGAFAVTQPLRDLRIALVDDVVTTCATASEISRVLLDAGAASVQVWCLARTP